MTYGYARVSTYKQKKDGNSLDEQKKQLINAGVPEQNIFSEAYTGTKANRPQFSSLIEKLEDGDTLIVTKIDRFARSVLDGVTIIKELVDRGVTVNVLNMGIAVDNKPMNKAMVTLLLMFAELERDLIVERTTAGKQQAKENGKIDAYGGRKKSYTESQFNLAMELLETHSYSHTAEMTGISVSTLQREKRKRQLI